MKNKYYADTYGPDMKALIACIKKAFEIAEADDEVTRIVFYSYTKKCVTRYVVFGIRVWKKRV